jgi:hypothetical protein
MKVFRSGFSVVRRIAWFGVEVVFPAFGIPRPFSYLAGMLWLSFMCNLFYMAIKQ